MRNYFLTIWIFVFAFPLMAQQNQFSTGLKFNDDAYRNTKMKAPLTRALYNLPSSATLKNWAPSPKSQGSYGTCVGWSTNYAALTISESIALGRTDKATITESAFSPGFIYHLVKFDGDENCSYGCYINDAFDKMAETGAVRYNDFNESCVEEIPSDVMKLAETNKIEGYVKLFELGDAEVFVLQAMKKSLSENKPVVIGMRVPPSFNYPTGCWEPTEDPDGDWGGHAMCVIGYDDSKYGGAFEIQNSWGDWWGNNGYIWVKYADFVRFTKYGYELTGVKLKNNEKTEKLSGTVRYVLSDGKPMKATFASKGYKISGNYKAGTRFRIYIANNAPAYVYAFGSDKTNKAFQVFPHAPNISPVMDYSFSEVALPDEDHDIEIDDAGGTNYLCVVYSKTELNFDAVQKSFEQSTGTFYDRVKTAMGSNMLDYSNVVYKKDGSIGFDAELKGQTNSVVLIVEIESN